jgi:hypothetical protein
MNQVFVEFIRIGFGIIGIVVGWWLVFRTEWVNRYFGNPLWRRSSLTATFNLVHLKVFGVLLILVGIILVTNRVMRIYLSWW